MIGGQHHDVVRAEQRIQLRQTRVDVLQRRRVACDIASMAVGGVQINQVGEYHGVVLRRAHRRQRCVQQLGQAGRFDLVRDADVGINIGDLADGNDFAAALFDQFLQNRRRRRLHRIIVAVARAFKFTRAFADKRPRDHAPDVVIVQLLAHDFAQFVQAFQTKMSLVRGDLKYRIRRGVENRFARADVLLTQFIQNHGARGVAITEVAG